MLERIVALPGYVREYFIADRSCHEVWREEVWSGGELAVVNIAEALGLRRKQCEGETEEIGRTRPRSGEDFARCSVASLQKAE